MVLSFNFTSYHSHNISTLKAGLKEVTDFSNKENAIKLINAISLFVFDFIYSSKYFNEIYRIYLRDL